MGTGDKEMARVGDVAAYVLAKRGRMSAMKLQKVIYYCQAWSLVWDEKALFSDKIKAWANGPVVPGLYHEHKGLFEVGPENFPTRDPDALSPSERETVDAVLGYYGDKSAQWLIDLTHREAPWKNARGDTPIGAPSEAEITPAAMGDYYSGLEPGA